MDVAIPEQVAAAVGMGTTVHAPVVDPDVCGLVGNRPSGEVVRALPWASVGDHHLARGPELLQQPRHRHGPVPIEVLGAQGDRPGRCRGARIVP